MRSKSFPWVAMALVVALGVVGMSVGQPPPRKGPSPGRANSLGLADIESALDVLDLPPGKRDPAAAALRTYAEDLRRVNDLAGAGLLTKLKEALEPDDF